MTWCMAKPSRPLRALPLPEDLAAANARLLEENKAMARYVHPHLANELMQGIRPRARTTLATILFADIRGFSDLSEQLGSRLTMSLLDEFLTIIVDCVDRHGGTLDKFIGDAVMVTFGVPYPAEDDADRAIEAAAAMLGDLEVWNRNRLAAGVPPIRIGIGIDTDIVIAGSIGPASRMDYTVIGDAVNTAARLQKVTQAHATEALVSARTRARLVREHNLGQAEMVRIGRDARPVPAHRLLLPEVDARCGQPRTRCSSAA